jgi:hypothetical protein
MLGEEPRIKILWYLIRIGDLPGAINCLFWTDKHWFKPNPRKENNVFDFPSK